MKNLPIYLDYMSTTPVDPRVIDVMSSCLGSEGVFGNPASRSHRLGFQANQCVESARVQVAELINVDPRTIVWTSGATESDNLAIKGAAWFYQRQGKHIITMSTEHKAVLDSCQYLQTQGFEVTYLHPKEDGLLDLDELEQAVRKDTILISIMHVNNETGVIQDIAAITALAHQHGVLCHVDAAQSAGKVALDLSQLPVDLLSLSSHKVYGPKGIGALYVRRTPPLRLVPLIHGGGHERGLRSGTLPTHQIVGMGKAFAIANSDFDKDHDHIKTLSRQLWEGLQACGGVYLNGHLSQRYSGCLNIHVEGVESESLLISLRDLAISTGSACNSAQPEPSHVLTAMGLPRQQAQNALRLSIGRFTTPADIDYVIKHFCEQVQRLRALSPIWDQVNQSVLKRSS